MSKEVECYTEEVLGNMRSCNIEENKELTQQLRNGRKIGNIEENQVEKAVKQLKIIQKEMITQQNSCIDCDGDCIWCAKYNAINTMIKDHTRQQKIIEILLDGLIKNALEKINTDNITATEIQAVRMNILLSAEQKAKESE